MAAFQHLDACSFPTTPFTSSPSHRTSFPKPSTLSPLTSTLRQGLSADSPACQRAAAALEDYDFSKEGTLEDRCTEAFAAVQHFEKTHCLALQARDGPPLLA